METIKSTLLLAIFCLLTVSLSAQVFHVQGGIHWSTTSDDLEDFRYDSRIGYNIGFDVRTSTDSWLYFQPGLHYYRTSAGIERIGTIDGEDDVIGVSSIKIPLNVGFYLTGPDPAVRVRLDGGVANNLTLGVEDNEFGIDKDDFKSYTLGANAGLGLDFSLVTLDLGYEFGLSDYFEEVGAKANVLTVTLGLVF